jgi:hypothetical protein
LAGLGEPKRRGGKNEALEGTDSGGLVARLVIALRGEVYEQVSRRTGVIVCPKVYLGF